MSWAVVHYGPSGKLSLFGPFADHDTATRYGEMIDLEDFESFEVHELRAPVEWHRSRSDARGRW